MWNKLIKRKIVNKAFKWIGEKYLKEKVIVHNDLIILFSLLKNANSYKYIDEIGYYYYKSNKNSASSSWKNYKISNKLIHGLFINIKFLYEKTGNTYFEKYICIYKLKQGYIRYRFSFNYLNTGFEFIKNVIIRLLESNYILLKDKIKIKNLYKKIFKNKNFYFLF